MGYSPDRFDDTCEEAINVINQTKELLAVIHRDGGHYTAEHGLIKSLVEASNVWYNMLDIRDDLIIMVDQYETYISLLKSEIKQLKEIIDGPEDQNMD